MRNRDSTAQLFPGTWRTEPPSLASSADFLNYFLHRTFPAVEHGTDLYGGGFDDGHACSPRIGIGSPGTVGRSYSSLKQRR